MARRPCACSGALVGACLGRRGKLLSLGVHLAARLRNGKRLRGALERAFWRSSCSGLAAITRFVDVPQRFTMERTCSDLHWGRTDCNRCLLNGRTCLSRPALTPSSSRTAASAAGTWAATQTASSLIRYHRWHGWRRSSCGILSCSTGCSGLS